MILKFNAVENDRVLYYNIGMSMKFKKEAVTDELKNIRVKNWEQITSLIF